MSKMKVCRLCLCKIEDILDPEFTEMKDKELFDQIKVIFGFDVDSDMNYPQFVCRYCGERVKSFYEYFQSVMENQERLKEYVDSEEDFGVEEETSYEPKVEVVFTNEIHMNKEKSKRQEPRWDIDRISQFITFRCNFCPSEQLADYIEWRNHMRICHDTDKPSYICCDTKLTTERSFLTHINKCHDATRKRRYSCAICLKEFQHKTQIEKHMKVHIRHDPNGYQCKKCPESFLLVPHWRTHQLLHEPNASIKDILFPCKKCPEELPTMKLLQAHLRNQHKRKFLCDLCAEEFNVKYSLTEHIRNKHQPNPEKFKCPHCEVAFVNKNNMKTHVKLLHLEEGAYPCDKCDKVAVTEKQLKNHIQFTHQLDRKFICKYCQKAFKRSCDLEDHESVHTGIKRHSCPKCERMFNSKSNMQSHAKRCKGGDF